MASTGSRKRRHKSHGVKDMHGEPSSGNTAIQQNQIERKQSRKEQQQQQQQQQQQEHPSCKRRQSGGCIGPILPEQGDQLICETKKMQLQQEQGDIYQQQQQQQPQELPQENVSEEMESQLVVDDTVRICPSRPTEGRLHEQEDNVETLAVLTDGKDKSEAALGSSEVTDHTGEHVENSSVSPADNALIKNAEGKINLIEAIRTENFEIVKTLLDECSAQAMVSFYRKQLMLLTNTELPLREQDVKLSLVSLLAVVSRLEGEHRLQLAKADPVGSLMAFIKRHFQSRELVSMVCVLLGMLLWDSSSSPWQPSTGSASASPSASASASASAVTSELPTARSRAQKQGLCGHETASSSSISQESGAELNPSEDFIRAFIECKGPETLIQQSITCASGDVDLPTAGSVLLPVMAMSTYELGQAWLAENSDSMAALSEILSAKGFAQTTEYGKASSSGPSGILSDLNLGTGMSISHVLQAYLAFLSHMIVTDKEPNAAVGILDEEEDDEEEEARERTKREKRRKKRQRKNQARQMKAMVASELRKGCIEKTKGCNKSIASGACTSDEDDGVPDNVTDGLSGTRRDRFYAPAAGAAMSNTDENLRRVQELQEVKDQKEAFLDEDCKRSDEDMKSLSERQPQKRENQNHPDLDESKLEQEENDSSDEQHKDSSISSLSCICSASFGQEDGSRGDEDISQEGFSYEEEVLQIVPGDDQPQLTVTYEANPSSESNDGWVKVGSKKQSHQKSHGGPQRPHVVTTTSVALSQKVNLSQECPSRQQLPHQQQQHLRWADVAKMGCSLPTRENSTESKRPLVILPFSGEMSKAGEQDSSKFFSTGGGNTRAIKGSNVRSLPISSKSTETVTTAAALMPFKDTEENNKDIIFKHTSAAVDEAEMDEEEHSSSNWQQVARQAFAVNIKASKEALEISVTSGGETDEEEEDDDTTSSCSECPISDSRLDPYCRQRSHLPSLPVTPVVSTTSAGLAVRSATSDTISSKKSIRNLQKKYLPEAVFNTNATAPTPRKYFSAIDAYGKSSAFPTVASPPLVGSEGDQHLSSSHSITKGRKNIGSSVRLPSIAWSGAIPSMSENADQQAKSEQLDSKEYFQMSTFLNNATTFSCHKEHGALSSIGGEEGHRHEALADLAHIGAKHARASVQRGFYFNEDARNIPGLSMSVLYPSEPKKQKDEFVLPRAAYEPNNSTNCSQKTECSPSGQVYRHEPDNEVAEDQNYGTSYLCEVDDSGERFMPSFSQMSGAVEDNPIVTSVVETVFTLSSSRASADSRRGASSPSENVNEDILPSLQSEVATPRETESTVTVEPSRDYAQIAAAPPPSTSPSPPPGFQFKKLPPVRAEKPSLCAPKSHAMIAPPTSSSTSTGNLPRDETLQTSKQLSFSAALDRNFAPSLQSLARTATLRAAGGISTDSACIYPSSQNTEHQQPPPSSVSLPSLAMPGSVSSVESQLPRLPVVGVVNPFSKPSLGRWDCANTITSSFHQTQNQQQQPQQQQQLQQSLQPLLQQRYSLTSKLTPSSCHSAVTSTSWLDKFRLVDASAAAAAAALTTTCCDVVPLFASNTGASSLAAAAATGTVGFPQMHIFRHHVQQVASTNNGQAAFLKQQKQQQQQQQLLFLHQQQQQQQQHQQLLIQQHQHMQQKRLESQSLHQKHQLCPPLLTAAAAGGIFNTMGGIAGSTFSSGSPASSGLMCPTSARRFTSMAPVSKHCMPLLSCLQQSAVNPYPSSAGVTSHTVTPATAAVGTAPARVQQPLSGQQRLAAAGTTNSNGLGTSFPGSASPPVLFPSDLRDDQKAVEPFPGYDDLPTSRGYQLGFIAESLVLERLIINQLRQQFKASLTANGSAQAKDATSSALKDSVFGSDLDYYASLYRVKLKDLLLPAVGDSSASARDLDDGMATGVDRSLPADMGSRRWRDALSRILETPWTKRQQYGDIILPSNASDFNISLMEYPLLLGYTTDGCEVAVLELDKTEAYIDPCLLDVMSDPDLDRHFILKCKAASEFRSTELVAFDLCDYTLAEYIQIVQLSQHQDPLSASRLAWQLLEAVKFVHQNLGIPHGNLKPSWIFVDGEGKLRLGGCGITTRHGGSQAKKRDTRLGGDVPDPGRSTCWASSEELNMDNPQPSMASDIQVAGMLLYFILTGGQHPFGGTPLEAEVNIARSVTQLEHIGEEANDLVSGMLYPDPVARPAIEHCLKHPFFWSNEKKFRLILIVGSDVLTEMKTGVALTGSGSPTMMEILSVINITDVSPNWVQAINPVVMKEMRSFRVYKNSLSELTLFIYNCCLHFDKISSTAKEVLDDPCRYFLNLFPCLFMSIYRSLKASDRTDRSCFKPFF
ncbi:hypothetical protein RRG08_044130 [Elysia crispata]|uniref:Uncharacterized protein n=1 Tax=Elysia crispata TaxID=231223 RepID=A0AAE1DCB9_9GAST|nr:hypothetical protein RRG08_044130 [Elysia crispata]